MDYSYLDIIIDILYAGAYRETQKGGARLRGGGNIDKNEVFCEILNKMSQKGGGRAKDRRPFPSLRLFYSSLILDVVLLYL